MYGYAVREEWGATEVDAVVNDQLECIGVLCNLRSVIQHPGASGG